MDTEETTGSGLTVDDFRFPEIWMGVKPEVIGVVGFCLLVAHKRRNIGYLFNAYHLYLVDGSKIGDIHQKALDAIYGGNVIEWAVSCQRNFHEETQVMLERLSRDLSIYQARADAAKLGLPEIERLSALYPFPEMKD